MPHQQQQPEDHFYDAFSKRSLSSIPHNNRLYRIHATYKFDNRVDLPCLPVETSSPSYSWLKPPVSNKSTSAPARFRVSRVSWFSLSIASTDDSLFCLSMCTDATSTAAVTSDGCSGVFSIIQEYGCDTANDPNPFSYSSLIKLCCSVNIWSCDFCTL